MMSHASFWDYQHPNPKKIQMQDRTSSFPFCCLLLSDLVNYNRLHWFYRFDFRQLRNLRILSRVDYSPFLTFLPFLKHLYVREGRLGYQYEVYLWFEFYIYLDLCLYLTILTFLTFRAHWSEVDRGPHHAICTHVELPVLLDLPLLLPLNLTKIHPLTEIGQSHSSVCNCQKIEGKLVYRRRERIEPDQGRMEWIMIRDNRGRQVAAS